MRRCVDKTVLAYALAALLLLLLFAANLFYGSIDIPCGEVLSVITGGECRRDVWRVVVLGTRLPQALTAFWWQADTKALPICSPLVVTLWKALKH